MPLSANLLRLESSILRERSELQTETTQLQKNEATFFFFFFGGILSGNYKRLRYMTLYYKIFCNIHVLYCIVVCIVECMSINDFHFISFCCYRRNGSIILLLEYFCLKSLIFGLLGPYISASLKFIMLFLPQLFCDYVKQVSVL